MNHQPAIFRSKGTAVHLAIQAAAVLGAKKITLVGCDESCTKFQWHWSRSRRGKKNSFVEAKEYSQKVQEGRIPKIIKFKEGRIWMTQIFKSYGIEVRRYFYKDGEHYKKGYEVIN